MKEFNVDVVNSGNEFLKEYYKKHPEWDSIRNLKDDLVSDALETYTIDTLSISVIQMSGYLDRLEIMTSAAVASVNEAYIFRKFRYFTELNKSTSKVTKAQLDAEFNSLKEKEIEAIRQYIADCLKGKLKSYYQFISTIQSRIGYLKSEMNRH